MTFDRKSYMAAYGQRPEVKAKRASPEIRAKERAYAQRPEVRAKHAASQRAYAQRPEVKARYAIWYSEHPRRHRPPWAMPPESKARRAAWLASPAAKARRVAYQAAYWQRVEVKARRGAYQARYEEKCIWLGGEHMRMAELPPELVPIARLIQETRREIRKRRTAS